MKSWKNISNDSDSLRINFSAGINNYNNNISYTVGNKPNISNMKKLNSKHYTKLSQVWIFICP